MFVLNQNCSKKRLRVSHSHEDTERPAKRKRTSQSDAHTGHRPPGFWDNLSKIHLTRGALREFDRRTVQSEHSLPVPVGGIAPTESRIHLNRFSRHGGPDLSHLRGFTLLPDQDGIMSQSTSSRKRSSAFGLSASGGSDSTRRSKSSYDPNFKQNMIDSGIYPHDRESKPTNIRAIRECLPEYRPSLSPSQFGDMDFEGFTDLNDRADGESRNLAEVLTIIEGRRRHEYHSGGPDHPFNHLEPLSQYLPTAKPDTYDGASPTQIDRRVRHDLGRHIVPCGESSRPAAPNFFIEGKSASGRADVAKLQACHDGAIGTRAMHSLQNYGVPEPQYDGNMKSYSTTYHPGTGTLQLYGHHATQPKAPREEPNYHMTPLCSFAMLNSPDTFREGATAIRNLRDRARTDRDELIDQANRVARHAPTQSLSSTLTGSRASPLILHEGDSDTSADELAGEVTPMKRVRHMPPGHSDDAVDIQQQA